MGQSFLLYVLQQIKFMIFAILRAVWVLEGILGPTYLFGDNLSTIISSTKSDGRLAKRWNILSFHRVCEAVAHGIVRPFHIEGKNNPANVLSKHTSSSIWYELMRPLIFWRVNDNESQSESCRGEGSINESPLQVSEPGANQTESTVKVNGVNVHFVSSEEIIF